MWDMTGLYTFLTLFLSFSVLNMHSFVSFDYLGHHNTLRDRRMDYMGRNQPLRPAVFVYA